MKSTINKPWGSYQIIEKGADYVVKKLLIKEDQETSLQSHNYRSEHWVVVEGSAEVTIDKKAIVVETNESVFIPSKTKHRIANKNKDDLVIIEIWHGTRLEEEDIIRYEDKYSRIAK